MDSLTHALTGAIIGNTLSKNELGAKGMVYGAIAANIPDLDVLFTPFFEPVKAMFVHRGFSHSIILAIAGSALLAYLLKRFSGKQLTFSFWWVLIALPWLSHLLMDIFNTYGTAVLEPFCSIRVSFDSMPIIDFNLLVLLTITLTVQLISLKKSGFKQLTGAFGLLLVAFYFLLNVIIKVNLETEVKDKLKAAGIAYNRMHSTPMPLTNLVWMVVVEDSLSYGVAQVNILDNRVSNQIILARNDNGLSCTPKLNRIKEFTKGYYTVSKTDKGYFYVNDLRFSSLEQTYPDAYVIRFKVDERSCTVQRAHPKRGINLSNIKKLANRLIH